MREIVWDTETTGFDPAEGHRIVEIGAVELENHLPTGRTFHVYLNPERDMPEEAFQVHGLSSDFLADKPRFAEIVAEFMAFVGDARLVAHNAAFDMRFINWELTTCGLPPFAETRMVDTLAMARQKFPGSPASLDALCRRFGVDNSARTKHGALLDSEILAEVYLELIGGRQPGLVFGAATLRSVTGGVQDAEWRPRPRPVPLPPRLSPEEAAAHQAFVAKLGPGAVWLKRGGVPGA